MARKWLSPTPEIRHWEPILEAHLQEIRDAWVWAQVLSYRDKAFCEVRLYDSGHMKVVPSAHDPRRECAPYGKGPTHYIVIEITEPDFDSEDEDDARKNAEGLVGAQTDDMIVYRALGV